MLSNYTIKQALPRLILAAIAINLSYFVCALLVDASNLLGNSIFEVLKMVYKETTFKPGGLSALMDIILGGLPGLAVGIGAGVGTAALVQATVGGPAIAALMTAVGPQLIAGLILMFISVILGVALAILVALIILASRQALIIILTVVSPIAFALYILPGTKPLFERWRKLFTAMLVFYPLFSLLYGGSLVAAGILLAASKNSGDGDGMLGGIFVIMAILIQFVPLFASFWLIKNGSDFLGKMGAQLQQRGKALTALPGKLGRRELGKAGKMAAAGLKAEYGKWGAENLEATDKHGKPDHKRRSRARFFDKLANRGAAYDTLLGAYENESKKHGAEHIERSDRLTQAHARAKNAEDLTHAAEGRLEAHRLREPAGIAAYSARKTASEKQERAENDAEKHRLDSGNIAGSEMEQHFRDLHESKFNRTEAESKSKDHALSAARVESARGRSINAEKNLKSTESEADKRNLTTREGEAAQRRLKTAEGKLKERELIIDESWTKNEGAQLVSDIDTAETHLKAAQSEAIGSRISPTSSAGVARQRLKSAQGEQEKNELKTETVWSESAGKTLISEIDTAKKNLEGAKNEAIAAGGGPNSAAAKASQRAATAREKVEIQENKAETARQDDDTLAGHFADLHQSKFDRTRAESERKTVSLQQSGVATASQAATGAQKVLKSVENDLETEFLESNEGQMIQGELTRSEDALAAATDEARTTALASSAPVAAAATRRSNAQRSLKSQENRVETTRLESGEGQAVEAEFIESEDTRAKAEAEAKTVALQQDSVAEARNSRTQAEDLLKGAEAEVDTAGLASDDGQAARQLRIDAEKGLQTADNRAKEAGLKTAAGQEADKQLELSATDLKAAELRSKTATATSDEGKAALSAAKTAEIEHKTSDNLLERDHVADEANEDLYLDLAASKAELEAAQTEQQRVEDNLKTKEGLIREYEGTIDPDTGGTYTVDPATGDMYLIDPATGDFNLVPPNAANRLQQAVKDKTLKGQAVSAAARVLAEEIDDSIIHNTADAAVAGGLDKYGAQRAVAIAENTQEKRMLESAQVERAQLGSISDEEVKFRSVHGKAWKRDSQGNVIRGADGKPETETISIEAQMGASSEVAHRGFAQNHIDTMIDTDLEMEALAEDLGYISDAETKVDSDIRKEDFPSEEAYNEERDRRVTSLVEESVVNSKDERVQRLRMVQKMFISDIGNNVPFLAGDTTRGAWGRGVSYGDRRKDWAKRLTQKLSAPTIQKWKSEDAKWIEDQLDRAERGDESYLTDKHRQSLQDGVDTILASADATANTKKEIKDFFDRLKAKGYIQRSFSDLAPPPTP